MPLRAYICNEKRLRISHTRNENAATQRKNALHHAIQSISELYVMVKNEKAFESFSRSVEKTQKMRCTGVTMQRIFVV